jgi:transcriptional regulator with XRE-family HTH domain
MANHNWTPGEVAKYFRVDIEEVMRWMHGTQKPKRDHCKLLANILQIGFGDIWFAEIRYGSL